VHHINTKTRPRTQVGERPGGCCDMRPWRIITDKYHKTKYFLVLIWRKSIHFWRRYPRITIFTFLFSVTLTLGL